MITVHVCINNEELYCVRAVRQRETYGRREYHVAYRYQGTWHKLRNVLVWSPIYGVADLARTMLVLAQNNKELVKHLRGSEPEAKKRGA